VRPHNALSRLMRRIYVRGSRAIVGRPPGCANDKQSGIDVSRRKGIIEFDAIIIGDGVSGFAASAISAASA
jgi:hypothetical protein